MKNYILTLLALAFCFSTIKANDNALNDTTIHYGNKVIEIKDSIDQVKVNVLNKDGEPYKKVYEGIFSDKKSYEKWTVQEVFDFNIPFVKKHSKPHRHYSMEAHWAGIGWGFANVADKSLNIGNINGMDLKAESSNEFYLNVLEKIIPICGNNWGITTGFGMTWHNYFLDNNTQFIEIGGVTSVQPANAGVNYSKSRLRTYHLTIPLFLEWQPSNKFFVTAGVVGGINTFASYKVEYRDVLNGYHKEIAGKGMNVNPISLDYCAQIGFDDVSIFAKYAAIDLFQANKGPKVRPVSIGLTLNF